MRKFRLYPDAKMTEVGVWNDFNDTRYCCSYFLDPTVSLFNDIGKAFLTEVLKKKVPKI